MSKLPDRELLRPDEVAQYFQVARSTIYTWMDTGKLRSVKIGGKAKRIPRTAVQELIEPSIS